MTLIRKLQYPAKKTASKGTRSATATLPLRSTRLQPAGGQMAGSRATADDVEAPAEIAVAQQPVPPRGNAFTELMKPKPKQEVKMKPVDSRTKQTTWLGRDGLGPYTVDPASFPSSRVIYYNEKFVVINDLYPKATVHLLLLPRDPAKNVLRPQEAFDDPAFLDECRAELKKVHELAASELGRLLGQHSRTEEERRRAMDADDPPKSLPTGRDWSKEIKSGIHANPSMSHLHIHVMSRDMRSECMRKSNHYQSFTTDFFVGLDQFPLSQNDHRRHYRHFPGDMICWRCGKNFQNKMAALKEHLEEEFIDWRKL